METDRLGGTALSFDSTCAVQRYVSPAGESPAPANALLQPGSYPSGGGGNEAAEAWEKGGAKGSLQIGRP